MSDCMPLKFPNGLTRVMIFTVLVAYEWDFPKAVLLDG